MTKADLIEQMVCRGFRRSTASDAVDSVISILSKTLSSGESVTLRGLGTFKVRELAPKIARNIAAGTPLQVPARKSVKLILSQSIKNALKK